jgi:hypothetical protein
MLVSFPLSSFEVVDPGVVAEHGEPLVAERLPQCDQVAG